MAALIDLSSIKTRIHQEILDIRQVAALDFATFWWWVSSICEYVVVCVVYVCAHVREKVMFEVYGGESTSDQYGFCFVFSHSLSILHFAVRQLLCWPFLLIY